MALLILLLLQAADPAQEIRRWIEALGSNEAELRDRAFRSLREKGEIVMPELREGLSASDPEVRARCRVLIRAIEFEPGAREAAKVGVENPDMRPDPEAKEEYEALVSGGRIDEILKEDFRWITYAVDGVLSDRQSVAFGSLRVLHRILSRRKIEDTGSGLAAGVDLKAFRSPQSRADEYTHWAQWWFTARARRAVAGWDPETAPAVENWEETLRNLRGGAGFEDPTAAQHRPFQRVKEMGKAAYPFIVRYIDHEDPALGNTAVEVLNKLTGRASVGVTGETKVAVKAEWEEWLKSGK